MFERPVVAFEPGKGFSVVGAGILVDGDESEGVHIAARNLVKDFAKVTGVTSGDAQETGVSSPVRASKSCVIIGTVARSPTIRKLKDKKIIDTSQLDGKWESWMTASVANPKDGYDNGLVIVGSDMRGAIFGTYSLSEQIGVSP